MSLAQTRFGADTLKPRSSVFGALSVQGVSTKPGQDHHARPASREVSESLNRPRPTVLEPVQDGFFEQRAIEIEYRTARGRTTRIVEPHYLMLAWPAWYLLVWDHLRHEVRTLRLDRIEAARLTDMTFQLRNVDEMLLVARDLFAPV